MFMYIYSIIHLMIICNIFHNKIKFDSFHEPLIRDQMLLPFL